MFDVFYSGIKPNLFAHEQAADSVDHARELSGTRYFWWVNYLTDYTDFDFLWEPTPWEADQVHIWPSQHQPNGGTQLVPKQPTTAINYNHPILERKESVPIVGIDHGEGITITCDVTTRYISDYLGTLRRVLAKTTSEYVWVINSVCDYSTFDFTWHPGEWQPDMLHVFASNEQKFGDTFYIHVPSFLKKTQKLALLEWFETIHFVPDICVPRKPVPIVRHDSDSQVDAVKAHEFTTPVVLFSTVDIELDHIPTVNLWREPVKTIVPLTAGASIIVVPREAKNHLTTQLYDYPYIDRTQRHMSTDALLDIVFIDNGEPNADDNFLQLAYAGRPNTLHRSSGVNGRVAAYQAAAKLSTTPWFFAVFAKLKINPNFDWSWQPDRLQESKHYIFHAHNPVNGLTYGHQAMIAYNKQLVLNNPGVGLDFTLDSAHEVVPILSGTAEYADTKWSAWRTAFRECLKLKGNTDVESTYRLNRWLGPIPEALPNSEWSRWGAEDAVEYYDAVGGDFAELRKSYDWAWLASYALIKRNLIPHQ